MSSVCFIILFILCHTLSHRRVQDLEGQLRAHSVHTEGAFPSSSPVFVGDGKVNETPAPPSAGGGGCGGSVNGEDGSKVNSGGDTLGVKLSKLSEQLSEHKPPRVNGVYCPVVVASPPVPGVAMASSDRDEGPSIDVGEVGSRGHSLPVAVATGSQQQQQRRQIVRGAGVERTVAVRGASVTVPPQMTQLPAGAGVAALASAVSPATAVSTIAAASRSSPQGTFMAPSIPVAASVAQTVEVSGRVATSGAAAAIAATTKATSSAVLQTATILRGVVGSVHVSHARPFDVVTRSRRGERQSMSGPEEHLIVSAAEMPPVHKDDSTGRNESIDLSSSLNSMDVLDDDGSGDNDDDDGGVLL